MVRFARSESCPACGSPDYLTVHHAWAGSFRIYLRGKRRCADCDAKYAPPTPAWFSIAAIYASGAVFVGSLGAARFIPEFLGPGENAARVGVAAVFLLLSLGALAVVVTAAVALYKWRGVSALPSTDFSDTAHCDAWGEFRPERRWE